MKHLFSLLAALTLPIAVLHADLVIVQKVEGGGQSGEQTIKIKGDKARTDLAQPVSMIVDGATGDSVTLMHAQRSFLKVPASQQKAMIEQVQKMRGNAEAPKLVDTGKKEKMGGYECEIFTANLGFVNITYWIARDFPNYKSVAAQMQRVQSASTSAMSKGVMPDLKDFPGMAVKTEMELNGQKISVAVVSVKDETLDPKLFTVPPGYKEIPGSSVDLNAPSAAAPSK